MKPKSRKNIEMQKRIADCLRKGLPLAGLISTLLTATSCDRLIAPPVGDVPSNEEHVVGKFLADDPHRNKGEKQPVDSEKNEKPVDGAQPEETNRTPPPPPGAPLRTAGILPAPVEKPEAVSHKSE